MALPRNLRNFDRAGVADHVAERSRRGWPTRPRWPRLRQLPFRFLSAYRSAPELGPLDGRAGAARWTSRWRRRTCRPGGPDPGAGRPLGVDVVERAVGPLVESPGGFGGAVRGGAGRQAAQAVDLVGFGTGHLRPSGSAGRVRAARAGPLRRPGRRDEHGTETVKRAHRVLPRARPGGDGDRRCRPRRAVVPATPTARCRRACRSTRQPRRLRCTAWPVDARGHGRHDVRRA